MSVNIISGNSLACRTSVNSTPEELSRIKNIARCFKLFFLVIIFMLVQINIKKQSDFN